MATVKAAVTGTVGAPASEVYAFLRDYSHHHPAILPSNFKELTVEEGGQGEGTLFQIVLSVYGRQVVMRMRVSEPEPGRVLSESDLDSDLVTTFTVEPAGEGQSTVTIESTWQPKSSITILVDRATKAPAMRRMYQQQLQNLDALVRTVPDAEAS